MAETTTEPKAEVKQQKAEEDEEERASLRGKSLDIIEKRRQGWVAPEERRAWHTSANIKQAYLLAKRLIIIIALLIFIASSAASILRAVFGASTGNTSEKGVDVLAEVHRHLERLAQLTNVAITPVLFNGTDH